MHLVQLKELYSYVFVCFNYNADVCLEPKELVQPVAACVHIVQPRIGVLYMWSMCYF